jgi:uncharacterized RDD family membrane protein YckC
MDRYRTFWRRFWAGFIDGLVFAPLGFVHLLILKPDRPHALVIGWLLFATMVDWAYSVCLHAYKGQTLGKMVTGVKVLDRSESRLPKLSQAITREIVYIVAGAISTARLIYVVATSQFTSIVEVETGPWAWLMYSSQIWFALEVITMLTNQKRRALHDFMAGTVVVRTA